MRPRLDLIGGTALAVALGFGVAAFGASRARVSDADQRRSTLLPGPSGALGFEQALQRLGVRVERFRRPPDEIAAYADTGRRTLIAVLGPTRALTVREANLLLEAPADLLLAGPGTHAAIACIGYERVPAADSVSAVGVPVRATLVAAKQRFIVDSADARDGITFVCRGAAPSAVDTLLRVRDRPAALRLRYDDGRAVILVADDRVFANRALRTTAAGPFALGLVVGRYDRVIVDEYHHGFAIGGSLPRALLSWSARSPWGWVAWQLAIVGVLALIASGIRFGPAQRVIDRRRRSPLEHVRALATALAAAQGHTVAIRLMVRGLRRRLSRGGRVPGDDGRQWLDGLHDAVESDDGRRALDTLRELTSRPVGTDDVHRAANAVEDVWEEMTKNSPGARLPDMPLPPRP